jgi:hypothetical protein
MRTVWVAKAGRPKVVPATLIGFDQTPSFVYDRNERTGKKKKETGNPKIKTVFRSRESLRKPVCAKGRCNKKCAIEKKIDRENDPNPKVATSLQKRIKPITHRSHEPGEKEKEDDRHEHKREQKEAHDVYAPRHVFVLAVI